MKNFIQSFSFLLIWTLSLNVQAQETSLFDQAQVLTALEDGDTKTYMALVSQNGKEIKIRVYWNQGATFHAKNNLIITNGTITSENHPPMGGLHKSNTDVDDITITQTEANKPVTVRFSGVTFASDGSGKYVDRETVTIPSTAPRVNPKPTWTKNLPDNGNLNLNKVIAGGRTLLAITDDHKLYEWSYEDNKWVYITNSVKSAAVDMFNAVWAITDQGHLARRGFIWGNHGHPGEGKLIETPTEAGGVEQIIAGGTKVLMIGKNGSLYEYDFKGKLWNKVDTPSENGNKVFGAAVDKYNSIWALNGSQIYRKKIGQNNWKRMDGYAREIFASSRRVMITGTDGQQYEWKMKTDGGWNRAGVYPKSQGQAVDFYAAIYIIPKNQSNTINSLYYPMINTGK